MDGHIRNNLNRFLVGLLVLLLSGLTASGGCARFNAQSMNADGVRSFQQAQYSQAAQQFQNAINADPTDPAGYYNLALTYQRIGKTEQRQDMLKQAEDFYNRCLDRAPEHRDCYRALAVLLVEEGRTDEAFRLLENWADRSPNSSEARIELARLFGEFNDRKSSKEQLVRALSIDPDNARAWAALGKISEEDGDRPGALTNYQRSLSLNSFQPDLSARVASLQSLVSPTASPTLLPSSTQEASRNHSPQR